MPEPFADDPIPQEFPGWADASGEHAFDLVRNLSTLRTQLRVLSFRATELDRLWRVGQSEAPLFEDTDPIASAFWLWNLQFDPFQTIYAGIGEELFPNNTNLAAALDKLPEYLDFLDDFPASEHFENTLRGYLRLEDPSWYQWDVLTAKAISELTAFSNLVTLTSQLIE